MARETFATLVRDLTRTSRQFSAAATDEKVQLLLKLQALKFGKPADVVKYHNVLLYLQAYPDSGQTFHLAAQETKRLAVHVERTSRRSASTFLNTAISGSACTSVFSLALTSWLTDHFQADVSMQTSLMDKDAVMSTLLHVLDPLEYEMSSSGMDWSTWYTETVGIKNDTGKLQRWIINAAQQLPGSTAFREAAFARFNMTTTWRTGSSGPTMTSGRAPYTKPFIHDDGLIKHVDLAQLVLDDQPEIHKLGRTQRSALVDLSRGVLASLQRETDPSTYAHEEEVLYLDMGRGLTIALYPMIADMKMAVQSYVGYMAFKNGVPCAYGGGWLLFDEPGFGVNIFEPFRGGESAWIVAQLLRAYHVVYGVSSFTVDPYQIGYGNTDGIKSGAFWFYYHLGFRPHDSGYAAMAAREWKKIQADRTHRSDRALLETLAASSLRWTLPGSNVEPIVADRIGKVVASHINTVYHGDRELAIKHCLTRAGRKAGLRLRRNHPVWRIAVLLEACGYLDAASPTELRLFMDHYQLKVSDERQYVRSSQTHRTLIDLIRNAEQRLSS